MHRSHDAAAIGRAVETLRRGGIDNLSIDLIFALPTEIDRDWRDDVRRALALEPEHLSLYGLTVEPHTPMGRWRARGELVESPEEQYEAEFLHAHDALARRRIRALRGLELRPPGTTLAAQLRVLVAACRTPGWVRPRTSSTDRLAGGTWPCIGIGCKPSIDGQRSDRRIRGRRRRAVAWPSRSIWGCGRAAGWICSGAERSRVAPVDRGRLGNRWTTEPGSRSRRSAGCGWTPCRRLDTRPKSLLALNLWHPRSLADANAECLRR